MTLTPFANLAFDRLSSGSYYIPTYSFGGGYSSYSSYKPLLFNFGCTNYGPSSYYGPGSTSTSYTSYAKSAGYSSYGPSSSSFAPSSYTGRSKNFGSLTFPRSTGSLQKDLVQNALSWVGKVNNDREGNRLFSNGASHAWCADFVTYNTRKTFGSKLPASFGSSSVSGLMNWGKNNNCYLDVTSASDKSQYIAQNVKPGDLMIEKRNGKSHTGIVTKVNSDGSFETVEGNTSNKVATRRYSANSSTLSGFVTLDQYVA